MENQMRRKIELFTAGCSVCEPVVEMVKSMACSSCEVVIYNVAQPDDAKVGLELVQAYGIKALPAIAIDGKLLSCCQDKGVSADVLKNAGIGVPL